MSNVINLSGILQDPWERVPDEVEFNDNRYLLLSLEQLIGSWGALSKSSCHLAVELEGDETVEQLRDYLPRLELIALKFDLFADGRAFSQARLLRDRMGYQGDIRAQGDVLRDQLAFMQRCGFTQFQLAAGEEPDLALDAFSEISHHYQPEIKLSAHC